MNTETSPTQKISPTQKTPPTKKTSPKRARKASTGPQKPVRKANGKAANGKAKDTKRPFGAHLGDFENDQKLHVLKPNEISRNGCFKSGMTVAECLASQKKAGYRGRRKYIRKARAAGRIEIR